MTEREAQIYEWIKEEPMISQQEIADRAGITRSSAAVHISNLMKKGIIRGKGYILQEENYITVVGAVNIDISGTPCEELRSKDSNPGKMRISFGGVGRNIAENISRLGVGVELITALGDDFYAAELERYCKLTGIELRHALKVSGANTSTYLCINTAEGDMAVAVNDMGIYESLTPRYIETKLSIINKGRSLVLDGNIPRNTLEFLAAHSEVKIFAEPVSVAKAVKFENILNRIFLMKPNKLELEMLSGVKIDDEADLERAAGVLLDKGVKHLVISMGADGVYYAGGDVRKHIKSLPCRVVNTTGCGDALFGGIIWGINAGKSVEEAINYGLAAAAACIEHDGTVGSDLSQELLERRLAESKNLHKASTA